MGLIQRQGLKFSIVNVVALGVSAASTLYVYPYALREVGLLRFLLDTAIFVLPFFSLGVNTLGTRYFPHFSNKSAQYDGFLGLLLRIGLMGFVLFSLVFAAFFPYIYAYYAAKGTVDNSYLWFIVPLVFCAIAQQIFVQFAANLHRIVVPQIFMDFFQKLYLPLLIVAYLAQWLTLRQAVWLLVAQNVAVVLALAYYLHTLGAWRWQVDWSKLTPTLRRDMRRYAAFGMLNNIGYMGVMKIDTVLVPTGLGMVANGMYTLPNFLSNVLIVPLRAVSTLSGPLFSKYWQENNLIEIRTLYQKASLNLLIIGLLMAGAFWVSVDDFYQFLPASQRDLLATTKPVILLLGLARLYDLATGVNNYLLGYSRYYYLQMYTLLGLAVVAVAANWWLLPRLGLLGAAVSMLLMTLAYNTLTLLAIWVQFRMQPFTRHTLWALLIAVGVGLLVHIVPMPAHPYAALLLRSGLYAVLYTGLIVWLRLSPDFNQMFRRIFP